MILRKLADAIRQQNWVTVVLEIFVVVVGIFIGLQVDDWNNARKDRASEVVYLRELHADFMDNRHELDNVIIRDQQLLKGMIGILEQSALEVPIWTVDEMNEAFRAIHYMPTFTPNKRAYNNMTGSGDLKLLKNRSLKNFLATYYSASEVTQIVQNTHELELVETFQPYIIAEMDYQAINPQRLKDFPLPPSTENDRILAVLPTREFRNVVTQKWVIVSDLLDQHRQMQQRNDAVIELLLTEMAASGAAVTTP